ncbi:unnamed protein product [Dovyalis caffra]|uniref:Uncharacterized protein n=1 Tax=Dovyalis caffra TaxID=77055 RepID=A0AAV1RAJ3_9ROSI|nr:unnamed protein product [Dovyalis caffra]
MSAWFGVFTCTRACCPGDVSTSRRLGKEMVIGHSTAQWPTSVVGPSAVLQPNTTLVPSLERLHLRVGVFGDCSIWWSREEDEAIHLIGQASLLPRDLQI